MGNIRIWEQPDIGFEDKIRTGFYDPVREHGRTTARKSGVNLSDTGFVLLGYALVFLLVLVFGVWANVTHVERATISQGSVTPLGGRIVVEHPFGGAVKTIHVAENDFVQKGAPLISLEDGDLARQFATVRLNYFDLLARLDRSNAEAKAAQSITFRQALLDEAKVDAEIRGLMEGQERLFDKQNIELNTSEQQLTAHISRIEQQIDGALQQVSFLKTQRTGAEDLLSKQYQLRKHRLTTINQLEAAKATVIDIDSKIFQVETGLQDLWLQKEQAILERANLRQSYQKNVEADARDLELQIVNASEAYLRLEDQLEKAHILAPESGFIYQLAITSPKAVISPAEPLLYIVPKDTQMAIHTKIPALEIEEISIGQEAEIHPLGQGGDVTVPLFGKVTKISADVIETQAQDAGYFEVEIAIDETRDVLTETYSLRAGSPVQVNFLGEKLTPFQYITHPIAAFFDNVVR